MRNFLLTRIGFPSWLRPRPTKADHFFRKPYSHWAAAILAFFFAGISPLSLIILDYDRRASINFEYGEVPWITWALMLGIVVAMHWSTKPFSSERNVRMITGILLSVVLFCGCLAMSYHGCLRQHVCMGGHLDHPPYEFTAYLYDGGWAAGLIVAAFVQVRCNCPFSVTFAAIAGFLMSLRFVFGSAGGRFYFY